MHPSLPYLLALQSLEVRLAQLRARLAEFPKKSAELGTRVESARAQVQRAKDALTQSLKDRKTYELDVEQWKEKVRKYKDQVYQVKSNEAYKALQHEIQMGEAEVAKAEDRLLDRMVAGEEYDRQLKAAEKEVQETEKTVAAERQQLEAARQELETELVAVQEECRQAMAHVPEDLLEVYRKYAKRHGGVAVAVVTPDETCSYCRVRLRPHTFQKLTESAGEEIIHCESCNLILYYVPPAQPPSVEAAAPQKSDA